MSTSKMILTACVLALCAMVLYGAALTFTLKIDNGAKSQEYRLTKNEQNFHHHGY